MCVNATTSTEHPRLSVSGVFTISHCGANPSLPLPSLPLISLPILLPSPPFFHGVCLVADFSVAGAKGGGRHGPNGPVVNIDVKNFPDKEITNVKKRYKRYKN